MKEILVDCDGVLADFTAYTLKCIGAKLAIEDITRYEVRTFLSPEEDAKALALWKDADWWESMPPIEGAQAGMSRLEGECCIPIILTAPWVSCKGWEWARRAWLKKHFGITHNEVLIGSRKFQVEAAMLIEDSHDKLHAWASRWAHRGGVPILFDAPYNRAHEDAVTHSVINGFARMNGWGDIDRFLEDGT